MRCYNCGSELDREERCPSCGADLAIFQRIIRTSNAYYNQGLERASVRNLSGALESLRKCLKFNKNHIDARNLLGLVYYEMGETVDALSEWVISRSYQPKNNPANRYLDAIQQNRGQLATINQTIKKYNQALRYCEQDSRDLAMIQLKKVLSLNPKLIRGHQLLALLYLQEDKLDLAKKSLRNAGKVDANNTLTLRYLKEVNQKLKEKGNDQKAKDDDLISYQSGNETIIMPKRFKESSLGSTILSVIIGLIVGAAVTASLIVPSVRSTANDEAQEKLLAANNEMVAKDRIIRELQDEIEALDGRVDEERQNYEQVEDKIRTYQRLIEAYVTFHAGETMQAGDLLKEVEYSYLSVDVKRIYNDLNTQVKEQYLETLYTDGYAAYSRGGYEEAIINLQKVVAEQMDYQDGNAAYYLAQAYRRSGDLNSAREYYQFVVDNYPGTQRARTSRNYVDAQE
ncbi:MAG: tetratricopeptide repeat protein [Agathobacter sp.]|nr:tetratricopeptide repeat protein [Agathobacter sp.]